MDELIVHFNELPVLPYNMDYLTYCKHCGTYNLSNKACVKCGQENEITLEEMVASIIFKKLVARELIVMGIYIGLLKMAQNLTTILGITLFSVGCFIANILIYKKYKEAMILDEVERYLQRDKDKIKADLNKQMGIAIKDVDAGNVVEAYDRFRYLAKLIDNDEIRTYKLICLRNFKLRSDMPLELKELLQEEYNTYLVDYIYEVSKLRKELIDDATLSYIVQYKEEVLMKHKGYKIMASVLSGALKSKFLLNKYAEEMQGYLKYFSKDRLLRLCKMQTGIKDRILRIKLLKEIKEIVGSNQKFEGYFKEV